MNYLSTFGPAIQTILVVCVFTSFSMGSITVDGHKRLFLGEKCVEEGFFRHVEDCSKFYRCVKEYDSLIQYDFDCAPQNMVFDESISVCNWPHATAPCDIREDDDEEEGDDEPSTRLPPSPTSMEPPLPPPPPPNPPGEEDTDGSGCGETEDGCITNQKSLP